MELTHEDIDRVVEAALAEDVGSGDATTLALVPADARCRAELLLEEPGVVCGVPVAAAVFRALDPSVTVEATLEEGTAVSDVPAVVAVIEGPARAVLTGERVALNLVGRLCGIASLTRRFAELTEGTPRPHPRHAQDDAGPARAREVRGALRRRDESPRGPLRRDPHQGEPHPRRRRHRRGARRAQRQRQRACRSRSRRTRSSRCAKPSPPERRGSCSTT